MESKWVGSFPSSTRVDWPKFDCKDANLSRFLRSMDRKKFTLPLQRLHTPSKRTTEADESSATA